MRKVLRAIQVGYIRQTKDGRVLTIKAGHDLTIKAGHDLTIKVHRVDATKVGSSTKKKVARKKSLKQHATTPRIGVEPIKRPSADPNKKTPKMKAAKG